MARERAVRMGAHLAQLFGLDGSRGRNCFNCGRVACRRRQVRLALAGRDYKQSCEQWEPLWDEEWT